MTSALRAASSSCPRAGPTSWVCEWLEDSQTIELGHGEEHEGRQSISRERIGIDAPFSSLFPSPSSEDTLDHSKQCQRAFLGQTQLGGPVVGDVAPAALGLSVGDRQEASAFKPAFAMLSAVFNAAATSP